MIYPIKGICWENRDEKREKFLKTMQQSIFSELGFLRWTFIKCKQNLK